MKEDLRQRAEVLLAGVERQTPGLGQLAEVLSLAVRVEPALLRKARLVLAPKLGVGVEADLWFGPLVESSGAGGFVFRREVALVLRERLAAKPARLESAWKLTRSFHSFIPPAAVLEEEVTWAALAGRSEDELNRKLGSALKAMLSSPSRGIGIARWALRALPRLPERAQRSESAELLSLGTVARVDGTWLRLNDALPERLPAQAWRVLGDLPRVALRIVREQQGISVTDAETLAGHRLELPDTRPPLLEVSWEEGHARHRKLLAAEPGSHLELPGEVDRLELRALDGLRWELTTVLQQEKQEASGTDGSRARVFLLAGTPAAENLSSTLLRLIPGLMLLRPSTVETTKSRGIGWSFVAESMLTANLIMIIPDNEAYWNDEFRLRELRIALLPYTRLSPDSSPAMRRAALEHIVVVFTGSELPRILEQLPPELTQIHWPWLGDANALSSSVVSQRLASRPPRFRERLRAAGLSDSDIRNVLSEEFGLPQPQSLSGFRHFPSTLPLSLGNAFVGRDKVLREIHYFLSISSSSPVMLIEGMAGVGKTRVALEYFYRYGPQEFPGGIFWVNANESEERLEEQLHGILRALRPDTSELGIFQKDGRNASRELAVALQEVGKRARILYVVDGIAAPYSIGRFEQLSRYCPGIGSVSVLATLRRGREQQSASTQLKLGVLDSNAAVELLTQGVQRYRLSDEIWEAIADQIANLPLALELLNKSLREGNLKPESLMVQHAQGLLRFLDERLGSVAPAIPNQLRSITEMLEAVHEQLSEQAKMLAWFLAQCVPFPIPIALLEAIDSNVLAATPSLEEQGFLSRGTYMGVPTFRMRWFPADFLRGRDPDTKSTLEQICHGLLTVMESGSLRDLTRWSLLRSCLPHAERVFERLQEFSLDLRETRFLELGIRLSQFQLAEGRPDRARRLAEDVFKFAVDAFEGEDHRTVEALACFAAVVRAEGDLPQAMSLYEQRLSQLHKVLRTTEHPELLVAIREIGEMLLANHDLAAARSQLELAVSMSQHIHGPAHPQTAIAMSHLGEAIDQMGDLRLARSLQEQAVKTLREAFGPDHLDTLAAASNLATTLSRMGEAGVARKLGEEVLERLTQFLGEKHPLTLRGMENLARVLELLGQVDQAGEIRARVSELEFQDSSDREKEELFPSPPDDVALQELINERFFSGETPSELLNMGNVRITSVDVTWDDPQEVVEARRIVYGGGHVGVDLMVDTDSLHESFPFKFKVEQHGDGSLTLVELTVDTSEFYEGQDESEEDGP